MSILTIPQNLQYPVFNIPHKYPTVFREGSKVLVRTTTGKELVVDDTSIDAKTLGHRRLLCTEPLAKINQALYHFKDVLLTSTKNTRYSLYIDSAGRVFTHQKTDWALIKSYLIEKVTSAPTSGNLHVLRLRAVHCPILATNKPLDTQMYVSLLNYSNGYIFMGYSDTMLNTQKIKI